MTLFAYLGALAIGISLGLTGAGGSILTLPVLVYLAGISPTHAVAMSLPIVGSAALAGVLQKARSGEIDWRAAVMFGVSGMLGAVVGSRFTSLLPEHVLMLIFSGLMAVIGIRMWLQRESEIEQAPVCRPVFCLGAGAGVGLLTGFLGVGGGFLLIPALVKFARLPMRMAIGTSLTIIVCNSTVGFLSHLGHGGIDWKKTAMISLVAIVGGFLGARLARRFSQKMLSKGFAALVLILAVVILWQNFPR